jgi:hypothetical protein
MTERCLLQHKIAPLAVLWWIAFFHYVPKILNFVLGYIGPDSFLLTEGSILEDSNVTSQIIRGGAKNWFWAPLIGNNAQNNTLTSWWFSHKTKFTHTARNVHFQWKYRCFFNTQSGNSARMGIPKISRNLESSQSKHFTSPSTPSIKYIVLIDRLNGIHSSTMHRRRLNSPNKQKLYSSGVSSRQHVTCPSPAYRPPQVLVIQGIQNTENQESSGIWRRVEW